MMRKVTKILLVVLVVLVAARLALPYGVKWYANRVLNEQPEYTGHIGDVDIHLYRGAYSIQDIDIQKRSGKAPVPFVQIAKVDLSLGWKELLRGQIAAKLHFYQPKLNFVDSDKPEQKQSGKEVRWDKVLDKLTPFKISRLVVEGGAIHFRNPTADPPVNIFATDLNGYVTNLTNSKAKGRDLFAHTELSANTLGNGKFWCKVNLNPREEKPTFDLDAKLTGMDLTALNAFFKKYGKLDFEKGDTDIVTQITAKQGNLHGYVKPLFRHLQVFSVEKDLLHPGKGENVFTAAWQAVVGVVESVLKNQPRDQFATRIPIEGPIKKPGTDAVTMVGGVLQNAFIQAFHPFFDKELNLTAERKERKNAR